MNAHPPSLAIDLSSLSEPELRRLELKIARKHSGRVPWIAVVWAFGNLAVWIALWPLVISGVVPIWLASPVAVVNLSLVYLPTHEAQHDIIARPGTKLRWLNELVGHATSWMIVMPFEVLRVTHLDHHRHTNDPDLDVDITSSATGPWNAIWRAIQGRQPAAKRNQDYLASLVRNGREDLVVLSLLYRIGFIAVLGGLAWNGYALEALFLWWLPYQIAMTYIVFFLSWAPHHPGSHRSRYTNTRSWKSSVGNIGSMGMQFHIVHHLHPYIPLHLTPAAYWEMRPILEARGCRLGDN
ncbi:fatty acid desaturase [Erythrobacter ani]|uniref:Fatty acid desaturase n=1 Tax=Erythrobacter ani TaxID=2827235 RepID=A0ABS6SLU9_9SPHN|nr:fatty acid desaturase [Erythrobacter ani]MBV7266023.1 fatty acid desaturase [Erythrobacter ani]